MKHIKSFEFFKENIFSAAPNVNESFFGLFKSKEEKEAIEKDKTISIKDLSNDIIEGAFMDAIDISTDYQITYSKMFPSKYMGKSLTLVYDTNDKRLEIKKSLERNKYKIEAMGYICDIKEPYENVKYVYMDIYTGNVCDLGNSYGISLGENMKHLTTYESFFGLFNKKSKEVEDIDKTITIDDLSKDIIEGAFIDAIDMADSYEIKVGQIAINMNNKFDKSIINRFKTPNHKLYNAKCLQLVYGHKIDNAKDYEKGYLDLIKSIENSFYKIESMGYKCHVIKEGYIKVIFYTLNDIDEYDIYDKWDGDKNVPGSKKYKLLN